MYNEITFGPIKAVEFDRDFIYAISRGLKPRRFLASDPEDSILVEENQYVDEMLF